LDALLPVDLVDEGSGPVLSMNLDEGLHVLALAFDPSSPTVQLTGALSPVEVDLVADDDGHAAILAFAVDRDVDLSFEWIEFESLGHFDELDLLFLGELAREAEGGEVVEQGLLLDLDGGRGLGFLCPGLGMLTLATSETSYRLGSPISVENEWLNAQNWY